MAMDGNPRRLSGGIVVALFVASVVLVVGYAAFLSRVLFGGEDPVAEVNNAADWLLDTGDWRDLERVADALMKEPPGSLPYTSRWSELPRSTAERFPARFWRLGGRTPTAPTYLFMAEGRVLFSWSRFANAFHGVYVFARPPFHPPLGFFGRRVSGRTFIVAYHCSRCSDNPPSDARTPPEE